MLSIFHTQLHDRALAVAGRYKLAHAELLSVIMEADEAKLAAAFGLSSAYNYCREKLGLTEDVACSFIAVVRKARAVPELKAAVEAGLDFTKAKQVARVITRDNQEQLLATAKESSCAQLERAIVRDHPKAAIIEQVKPIAEDRHKLQLGLSEELLTKLRRAQNLVCNKAKKAASLEDTLAALLEVYLDKEDPQRKAARAPASKKAPNLRATSIPAASIHAVNKRDQGCCQAKDCKNERWIEIHHVQHRTHGGDHTPDNLITLCGFHHRQHHRQEKRNGIHPPRNG